MAELRVHLALERASGVLAGIVAALAQKKLELKTQKLTRATEGRGGALDIRAEGEPGDIAALAEHLGNARGVGEVVRIEVDGVIVYFDGAVVEALESDNPFTLDDEPGSDDVDSELDAFLEPEPTDETPPPPTPVESEEFLEPTEEAETEATFGAPAPKASADEEGLGPLLRPVENYPDEDSTAPPSPESEPVATDAPTDPEPSDPSSGWGDEELDDWADDVEALDRPEPESQVGIDPEPTAPAADAEPDTEPESANATEPEPQAAEIDQDANQGERDGTAGGASNGADRTAATLRRRRRRRR